MDMKERIKAIRTHEGLNQRAFAKRINVAAATLAQFETGVRTIKDIHIAAICREFCVSEDWLRTGEGEMFDKLSPDEEFSQLLADMAKRANPLEKQFIMEFMKLDDSARNSIWDFWEKVFGIKRN